ncbi:hypothetical protein F5888DRAFT_970711 [Russula emetica]|nr:hypothetical protein F5888DRAFT_970711 [Russula emetica]
MLNLILAITMSSPFISVQTRTASQHPSTPLIPSLPLWCRRSLNTTCRAYRRQCNPGISPHECIYILDPKPRLALYSVVVNDRFKIYWSLSYTTISYK